MLRDPKNTTISAQAAEETATAILVWLAGEPDMLGRFLGLTGLRADQLRQAVGDPGLLAGMIDFLMAHEPTLLSFCEATGTQPEIVAAAWRHYARPPADADDDWGGG